MISVNGLLNAGGWSEVVGMNMSEGQNKLYGQRCERQPASKLQFSSHPGHVDRNRSGPLGPHYETVSQFALNVPCGPKANINYPLSLPTRHRSDEI